MVCRVYAELIRFLRSTNTPCIISDAFFPANLLKDVLGCIGSIGFNVPLDTL